MMVKDPSGEYVKSLNCINSVFDELMRGNDNISVFDSRKYPFYDENQSGNGLFIEDLVHYKPEVNWWNAEEIVKEFDIYCEGE